MDQRKRLEVKKNAGKGKRRLVRGKERWEGRRLREAGGKKWRGGKRLEGRLEGEESRRQRMYRVGKGGGKETSWYTWRRRLDGEGSNRRETNAVITKSHVVRSGKGKEPLTLHSSI